MLVPQITGGLPPGVPVTEKVSVRHWVIAGTSIPAATLNEPPVAYPMLYVTVFGPVMTKVLKSRRSCDKAETNYYGWVGWSQLDSYH